MLIIIEYVDDNQMIIDYKNRIKPENTLYSSFFGQLCCDIVPVEHFDSPKSH